jgi:hypothetical protein
VDSLRAEIIRDPGVFCHHFYLVIANLIVDVTWFFDPYIRRIRDEDMSLIPKQRTPISR